CDSSIDGGANCGVSEYMDLYDVMGASWGPIGSLSAPQADLIGLLPPGEVRDLQGVHGTQNLALTPMSGTGGTRAIRLGASDGLIYWLEYRSATGQDAWLGDPHVNTFGLQPGVLLRVEEYADDTSLLLDATPSPAAGWNTDTQTALTAGQSVWLSGLDYYVTVKSTGTQAVVQVQAGDAALPRDLDRNYLPDLLAVDSRGGLYRYPGNGTGGFTARSYISGGWLPYGVVMAGDMDGSGNSQDVLARDSAGTLWLYPGNGHGTLLARRSIGGGWQAMDALIAPGDLTGDGVPDLLARRRSDGVLLLYPGNGAGAFRAPTTIGKGWGAMTSFIATGDWDTNGTTDFLVRRNDGALLQYSANGHGGVSFVRTVAAAGWNPYTSIIGAGDWDGDGLPDLLARTSDGSLWLYSGDGMGGFAGHRQVSGGWATYRMVV
ncbi:MAG: FG-GAP repeat domain-containing protein, partial [Mycobacteriales bacterium]